MENDKENYSTEKFIYDKVYDELNRSRDWPIKIMAFVSAIYLAIIGLVELGQSSFQLTCLVKWIICMILFVFCFWTIVIIGRQHLNYLNYRNIQIRLQNRMGISDWSEGDNNVIPNNWAKEKRVSLITGFQGWGFYAIYVISICAIAIVLVIGK